MTTRKYRVQITWMHRKWGPKALTTLAEGSSIRRAINKALVKFQTGLAPDVRKDRRDAHAQVSVQASRLSKEKP